jgi:hypothetical protein
MTRTLPNANLNAISFNNIYLYNETNFTSFLHLRKSSFISFFIENMIDVPICFKKSKSLKFKNFEIPTLKFINLLMSDGKKEKIINYVFKSFFVFFNNFKINSFKNSFLSN